MTTKEIIAALESGARASRQDPYRQGNLIHLQGPGEIIMTGDLHGHQLNFDRLVRFSQLDKHPKRHLVLHELLHSTMTEEPDQCHSYLLEAQAAQLKALYPNQVHVILGNHAMAQVSRDEVLKNGQPMVRALNTGLHAGFGEYAGLVMQALDDFILSLPLAIRTDNRIWLSHSLPSSRHLTHFDDFIFEKVLSLDDMKHDPSLRALAWDRSHSAECIESLRKMWDVDMFIVGHQPQAEGYARPHDRMIILASDHSHGCYLPFELQRSYSPDELFRLIRPLAAIA
jgi:hypothetical protein